MTGFGNPNFEDSAGSRLQGRGSYMSRAQGLLNRAQALANKGQAAPQMKRANPLMRDDVSPATVHGPGACLACRQTAQAGRAPRPSPAVHVQPARIQAAVAGTHRDHLCALSKWLAAL